MIICGIAGIWHRDSIKDVAIRLQQMTASLQHRGPDGKGFYHDSHMALGHTRLAIMDLSDASAQPFYDSSGRYVLVYNGEIYNYKEIAQEITAFEFVTHGDTELVMAAFASGVLPAWRDSMAYLPLQYGTLSIKSCGWPEIGWV